MVIDDTSRAPATRAQALAARLEAEITERRLQAGDPFGTIEGWRASSGYARATVSEALRLLVDRGVIDVKPGRGGGVFVARTGPVVRLRHTLISVHGEATTLADAIAVREALEPVIVLDAARSRTAAQVRRLRTQLGRCERALDDHDAFIRAVWGLHEQIAAVTPNELLRAIYLSMMHIIDEGTEGARSADEAFEQVADDRGELEARSDDRAGRRDARAYREHRLAVHRELIDAIEAGDLERASRAAAAHAGEAAS